MPNLTIRAYIVTATPAYLENAYVRWYDVSSPATIAVHATDTVTKFFSQQEFDDHHAISSVKLALNAGLYVGFGVENLRSRCLK